MTPPPSSTSPHDHIVFAQHLRTPASRQLIYRGINAFILFIFVTFMF
jgi:hypothetical protein